MKLSYKLDYNIVLSFDETVKHEKYSCEWYHGIIFYVYDDNSFLAGSYFRYDVIHNIYLGNRILINDAEGWRDIPFEKSTFGFLPTCVKVSET
jgi:hypothetical protein